MANERIKFNRDPELDLSIIIVSFNVKEFLRKCLRSITDMDEGISYEIFVADNNSSDGTREMVEKEFPQVKLIHNRKNLGFSEANNRAVSESGGQYILLLNPDTFVYEGTLKEMVTFMERHPEAGAAGCRNWLDEHKTYQINNLNEMRFRYILLLSDSFLGRLFATRRFLLTHYWEKSWDVWTAENYIEVPCIVGAFMILRRKAVEEIGLMDPAFYMFCEDNDLCKRIREREWKIYLNPKGQIVHYVSKSIDKEKVQCNNYLNQSLKYYIQKHYGAAACRFYWGVLKLDRFIQKGSGTLSGLSRRLFKNNADSAAKRLSGRGDRIRWDQDDLADSYLVEISQDRTFTQKVGVFTKDDFLVVPYDFLVPDKDYFWRVIPFKSGRYLNWKAGGKFSK